MACFPSRVAYPPWQGLSVTPVSFQGARYELALAASFLRAGFEVRWLSDARKHAEFSARLATTNEQILVEGKSRRRPGILHEAGSPKDGNKDSVRQTFFKLCCREALKKETNGIPFLIAIDVNLPQALDATSGREKWLPDVNELLDRHPDCTRIQTGEGVLSLPSTNFNWHYLETKSRPGPSSSLYIPALVPFRPIEQ